MVGAAPGDLRYYCDILERNAYRVRTYESYHEGIRCLGDEVFDFVMVTQGTPTFARRCVLERATEIDRHRSPTWTDWRIAVERTWPRL